jgi:hypothetical protein
MVVEFLQQITTKGASRAGPGAGRSISRHDGQDRSIRGASLRAASCGLVFTSARRPEVAMIRMQRTFWCLIACLSLWSGAADADTVVRRFPGGSGQEAVGIIDASVDTEIHGPQALTAGENGELFLLDQVNNRILRFDPKNSGAQPRILVLPNDVAPSDLVVRRSEILVWDGSVRALQTTGSDETSTRGLEEISTRAGEDDSVLSAFAQMGSAKPADATELLDPNTRAVARREQRRRARQHVASRGAGSVTADVIPEKAESRIRIEVRRQGETNALARLQMSVRDRLGTVEFLEIDNQGRMFVLAENVPALATGAAAFIARYSPAGALEGIYELPLNNETPLSRRFVTVSGDGDVYFLRTQRSGADVIAVGFRPLRNAKVISVGPPATPVLTFGGKGPVAAVRPLSRQQVIETAFAFEGVQWQLTRSAYGREPDTACTGFNRIRRPSYLHGKLGQQVRGVPYCWGCHGSLTQIGAKLSRGVLAGNVCTRNAPRTDVTGVDCSAFVSAAWGLATHFTTAAIPAITSPISNVWDLRPGDALNKPHSHVMLFLRFTPDRKAEVMEAAPGACNGRVCRNVYPIASLLARGYTPVRFRALANDASEVAQARVATPERPKATKRPQRR